MDTAQTEKLKALALAIPGAPWKAQHPYARARGWEVADSSGLNQICENVTANLAAYIAAANPATVLELIAEIERLRAELAAGAAREGGNTSQSAHGCHWPECPHGDECAHARSVSAPAAGAEKDAAYRLVSIEDRAKELAVDLDAFESDLDAAIAAHTKAKEGA